MALPEDPSRLILTDADITRDGPLRDALDEAGSGGGSEAWFSHAIRRDTARHRRGGTIGTDGKQAIAVRIDHGIQQGIDKGIFDRLDQHGIPWHLALCAEHNFAINPLEVAYPWDDIRDLSATGGCEVGNHSRTHGQATGTAQLTSEIVDGLNLLQAQVPEQAVEVWTQPGVTGTQYDGWKHGFDVESITTTEAGKLILANHGVVMGARDRQFWAVLDGVETVGLAARFVDSWRPSQVVEHVQNARRQSPAVGGVLALHPVQVDRGGSFTTTAEVFEWIDWLAAERDAGRIELLTHAGLAIASSRDSARPSLAQASGVVAPGGSLTANPIIAVVARQFYGAMWQAIAKFTATGSGDVTLTMTSGSTVSTITQAVTSGQTYTMRRHLTLPLTQQVGVNATLTATAGADVADLRIQAV